MEYWIFLAPSAFWFHRPSLGSMFCGQQFFIWISLLPITTSEHVSGLYQYLSGNWRFGDYIMQQNCCLNCYQFPNPTAILCFYIFTFPIFNSRVRILLPKTRIQGLVDGFKSHLFFGIPQS